MKRSVKVVLVLLLLLTAVSVSATYYKYFVLQDFEVEFEIDCGPETESCFTWICDPAVDGEDYCTGDPEEDTWHYKLFYRNASNLPSCDLESEDCPAYECTEGEEGCYELTCTEELALEMGMTNGCTGPGN